MAGEFIYKTEIKYRQAKLAIFCLCFPMVGCIYTDHNWGEQLNTLNTDLDKELRKSNIDKFRSKQYC